ncbi:MAG: type II toxin-antitoxin system HicA family toxin [Rectinemataceae bacterium]
MTGRQVVKLLETKGWALDRISSSHHIYRKAGFRPFSVPIHGSKDLKVGTLHGILKDAGLK